MHGRWIWGSFESTRVSDGRNDVASADVIAGERVAAAIHDLKRIGILVDHLHRREASASVGRMMVTEPASRSKIPLSFHQGKP